MNPPAITPPRHTEGMEVACTACGCRYGYHHEGCVIYIQREIDAIVERTCKAFRRDVKSILGPRNVPKEVLVDLITGKAIEGWAQDMMNRAAKSKGATE
jgi:hypothetical protein